MQQLFQISFILIFIGSILCIELNMMDYISEGLSIEMIDFHEEGSGENEKQESSEEELEIEYSFGIEKHNAHANSNVLDTTAKCALLSQQTSADIHLPPPEQV